MSPPVDLENGRQREYDENTPLLREQGDGEGDGSSNIIIQQTTTPMVSQERAQRLVALDLLRGLLMVFESIGKQDRYTAAHTVYILPELNILINIQKYRPR